MATQTVFNGVNVDNLLGVIDAIKGTPTVADFKFRIENKWMNGGHNRTTVGNFFGACEVQTREGFVLDNAEHQILLGEAIDHGVQAPIVAEHCGVVHAPRFDRGCDLRGEHPSRVWTRVEDPGGA